jgi:hypothetical protein
MSDQAMTAATNDAPLLKRTTDVLTVIGLIVTLCSPLVALAWSAAVRLDRVEQAQKSGEKSEEIRAKDHDAITEMKRDVEWIRRTLEAKEKGK